MSIAVQTPDEMHEPPPSTTRVLVIGLVGVAFVLVSFLIGLIGGAPLRGFETHWADGPRAFLCVTGLIIAGCAVSMYPGWYGGWLCGAAAGLLGYGFGGRPPAGTEWYVAPPRNWYAGLPNSWDSVQLFFGVACAIGIVGAVWTRLPRKAVLCLMLLGVAYHFSAILAMVTSPPPQPWLTTHYSGHVVREYTQFAYFTNAYQFYSPDPGPASQIWVCIEYRPLRPGENVGDPVGEAEFKDLPSAGDPDAPKVCEWVYVPNRESNHLDPLGLTYYRRLSITENVVHVQGPNYAPLPTEQDKVLARRRSVQEFIPLVYGNTPIGMATERRVPDKLVSQQVLPSYARHFASAYTRPDMQVRSIRIYRVQHSIISAQQFHGFDPTTGRKAQAISPNHPTLYLPYFLGNFSRDGRLIDPMDPMLYWMVPIVQDRQLPENLDEYRRNGGYPHYFIDYVSRHAGCDRPIKE